MKRFLLSMLSTLVLLSLSGQRVQAEQLSAAPDWSYNFRITPTSIASSNVKINFAGSEGIGTSKVALGQIQIRIAEGATIIPSGSMWTGALTLSDAAGVSKPLLFQSTLSGTLWNWNIGSTPPQPNLSSSLPAGWSRVFEMNKIIGYAWTSPNGNVYTIMHYYFAPTEEFNVQNFV